MTDLPTGPPAGGSTPEPSTPAPSPSPSPSSAPDASGDGPKPRRRGSRGGRNRSRPRPEGQSESQSPGRSQGDDDGGDRNPELPDLHREGRPSSVEAAEASLVRRPEPAVAPEVRKPQIGDSMPAPRRPRQAGRRRPADGAAQAQAPPRRPRPWRAAPAAGEGQRSGQGQGQGGGRGSGGGPRDGRRGTPVEADLPTGGVELDDDVLEARRGRERKGRPVGRYLMCVHVDPKATQIAVLEGRALIEHYVSRPSDDVAPDPRQHLPRQGPERAARHGGRLRRHRHAEERRAVPGRRPLRPRGRRAQGPGSQDRADAPAPSRRSSARSRRTPSGPRAPASPRRCRCPAGSSC